MDHIINRLFASYQLPSNVNLIHFNMIGLFYFPLNNILVYSQVLYETIKNDHSKKNEHLFLPFFETFYLEWVEKYLSHFKNMQTIPNMPRKEKAAIHYFSAVNQHKREYFKSLNGLVSI